MARVRTLVVETGRGSVPKIRQAFRAVIYSDFCDGLLWTCAHMHPAAVEARMCGVRHITDPLVGPSNRPRIA